MTLAGHHGDNLSEVLRAALCAYVRDRDTYWAAVTPPAVDGPAQPAFSHAQAAPKPWKWDRPVGYERPASAGISQSAASGSAHAAASLVRHDDNTR